MQNVNNCKQFCLCLNVIFHISREPCFVNEVLQGQFLLLMNSYLERIKKRFNRASICLSLLKLIYELLSAMDGTNLRKFIIILLRGFVSTIIFFESWLIHRFFLVRNVAECNTSFQNIANTGSALVFQEPITRC